MPSFVNYKLGGGLNLKASSTDMPDHQLRRAVGCRIDTVGAVSADYGRTKVRLLEEGQPIEGVVAGYRSNALKRIAKTNGTVYEDGTSLGEFEGTYHLSGASYNAYTYLADGKTVRRWDGTTLEEVGLDAPTAACTATAATGTGGDLNPGVYKYWVTFWNGVAESNFSPVATVTVAASDDGVDLTAIPVGGATVKRRRIYRSDTNGSAKYYLTEITNNTATTYTDTSELPEGADEETEVEDEPTDVKEVGAPKITNRQQATYRPNATLIAKFPKLERRSESGDSTEREQIVTTSHGGLADWTDHDPPPDNLRGLIFHQEQFFGISGNDIVFSRVGEPEHWPVFNKFRPGRRAAEVVEAILPLNSDIMIYTDSGVYKLSTVSGGFTPSSIRLMQLDSPVGITGPYAVSDVLLGGISAHVFVADFGIYLCDGQSVQEVGYMVEGLFFGQAGDQNISGAFKSRIVLASLRDKVYASYNDGQNTLIMDFQNPQSPEFTTLDYGYTSFRFLNKTGQLLGGASDGVLYTVATTSPASSVLWEINTKDYQPGGPQQSFATSEVIFDADLGRLETTAIVRMDTGHIVEWTITPTSSGRQQYRYNLPPYFRGRSVRLDLSNSGQANRHIYSVGFTVDAESAP